MANKPRLPCRGSYIHRKLHFEPTKRSGILPYDGQRNDLGYGVRRAACEPKELLCRSQPDERHGASAHAFEPEIARIDAIAADRDRAVANEQKWQQAVEALTAAFNTVVQSQGNTVAAVERLLDMVDQRTEELVQMHQHTSGLIGTRLTEGAERKRLLGQFQELYTSIEHQVQQITLLVKQRINEAKSHFEEARREGLDLVPVEDRNLLDERQEPETQKDRGWER